MKNISSILFASAAVLLLSISACGLDSFRCIRGQGPIITQTHSAKNFTAVKIETEAIVNIYFDTAFSISINGQQNIVDNLNLNVSSNTLVIRNAHCVAGSSNLTIDIHAPSIDDIDLAGSGSVNYYPGTKKMNEVKMRVSGSGNITGGNTILADNLRFTITGSGRINADANCNQAQSSISGSGNLQISGKCITHNISITGSGKMEAFGFDTENVNVDVTGSGKAYVSCSKNLDVDISGSGRVYYKGSPNVTTRITGSGSVSHQ